mmetsp:Transcript_108012/g.348819  ORF Transcript_108012/g.348819 Transcript_108012/m.348819 type:complete len:215 (-) Transcript_108012:19-663(-)
MSLSAQVRRRSVSRCSTAELQTRRRMRSLLGDARQEVTRAGAAAVLAWSLEAPSRDRLRHWIVVIAALKRGATRWSMISRCGSEVTPSGASPFSAISHPNTASSTAASQCRSRRASCPTLIEAWTTRAPVFWPPPHFVSEVVWAGFLKDARRHSKVEPRLFSGGAQWRRGIGRTSSAPPGSACADLTASPSTFLWQTCRFRHRPTEKHYQPQLG